MTRVLTDQEHSTVLEIRKLVRAVVEEAQEISMIGAVSFTPAYVVAEVVIQPFALRRVKIVKLYLEAVEDHVVTHTVDHLELADGMPRWLEDYVRDLQTRDWGSA